jgi:hypothetical protein
MSLVHRVGQIMVLSCLLLPGAAQAAKGSCPGGTIEYTPFGDEQLAWPAAALLKTFDPPVATSSTDEVIRFEGAARSIHIATTALIRRHQDESCGVLVELLAPGWLPLTEGGLLLPTKTRLWLGFATSADLYIWAPETLSIRGTRIGPRLSVNLPDRRKGPLYILTEYISVTFASLRQVEFVEPFVEGGLVWRGLHSRDRGSIRWGTLGEDSLFYGIAVPAGSVLHSPLQPGDAGVWAYLPGGASRRFWFRHAHLRLDALTTQTPLGRRVQGLVQVGQEAPVLFDVLATPEHTTDCFAFRSERPTGLSLTLNCGIEPPRLETYRRNEQGETVVASWDVGSRSVEEQRSTATSTASSPEPTRRSRSNGPLSGFLFGPVTPASP